MKDKLFGILQRVGRSFMLPIAILLCLLPSPFLSCTLPLVR